MVIVDVLDVVAEALDETDPELELVGELVPVPE